MNVLISKRGRVMLWLLFGATVAVLYAPLILLALFSVNDNAIPAFPFSGLTGKWYEDIVHNQALLKSLRTSALVAVVSAFLSVLVGLPAAYAVVRRRFRLRSAVSGLVLSPLIMPYIVLGIALLVFFRAIGVEPSTATVVLGHSIFAMPFVVLVLLPRLERIPVALDEAARDLGAGPLAAFFGVTFPLLAPATFSAYLIAFTLSFDEYPIASFLVGDQPTFPVYLFSQLRFPQQLPQVIAVAVLVMAVSLLVLVVAEVGRSVLERRVARDRSTDIGGDE